jgi:hypothetical protein
VLFGTPAIGGSDSDGLENLTGGDHSPAPGPGVVGFVEHEASLHCTILSAAHFFLTTRLGDFCFTTSHCEKIASNASESFSPLMMVAA